MLWTRWSSASSEILLTMSSQAYVEKNEGSAGERVAICLWFCKILFRYYLSVTLQLICMPLFHCCVHCYQLLPWYLAPLGYGLDVSGPDARILKEGPVS
jgi:hypothetical protein